MSDTSKPGSACSLLTEEMVCPRFILGINLRRNPHVGILCVEKKLYSPSLPVLQKRLFIF